MFDLILDLMLDLILDLILDLMLDLILDLILDLMFRPVTSINRYILQKTMKKDGLRQPKRLEEELHREVCE